jgi:hypothetical protein
MGKEEKGTMTRDSYVAASRRLVASEGPATARAEQKAHKTGKLNPLVDPAGYGVIRRSLPRFEKRSDDLWVLAVGTPMPIETRADTTGSMGGNVDVILRVMPNGFEAWNAVLSGYDPQIATGIFGDVQDRFVLCRPQFEMIAEKIVEQLTLMVPERDGGDTPEDPHYGLFGAAYLTDAYVNRIGLMGYDFTISDAPARDLLDEKQLIRIFGKEVFVKATENGHEIGPSNIPATEDVVRDLLERAHAFFLQVGDDSSTKRFWTGIFGKERVVMLPDTELLPQVQAVIIGLTEGTLELNQVEKFLQTNNVSKDDSKNIVRSVAGIPIGAQAALPNFSKRPQKGDLFKEKTDLWPTGKSEVESSGNVSKKPEAGPNWL